MSRTVPSLFLALAVMLPAAAFAQDYDTAGEQAMLGRVNALRAENGLAPLTRDAGLDAIARAHSLDMAGRNQLAHVSPHTGTPEDRVRRAGIEAGVIAENVAMHRDTANAQVALLGSAPHRANMLSPDVTDIGIGSVRTERGVFVTQLFVSRPDGEIAPEIASGDVIEPEEVDAPAFGLIPPFLEEALEDPAAAIENLPESLPAAPGALAPAIPGCGTVADETPAAPPAAPRGAAPVLSPAPNAAAPANANDALRQLVDFANAFLNGY